MKKSSELAEQRARSRPWFTNDSGPDLTVRTIVGCVGLLSADSHLWLTPEKVARLLERARRDAEAANRGGPAPVEPKPIRIHKLQHRLSEQQLQELIQRYEAGAAASALSKRYGIGKSSVLRLLHERGVPVRARGRYW